jgi:glycosyltransferase involved in cell wall biosynthesis
LNAAHALEQTVASLRAVGYANLDYIVIDGGSTDGTLDVIRGAGDIVRHWHSGPDRGVFDGMNKAWALAQPESFMLFLGAGDCLVQMPDELPQCEHRDVLLGRVRLGERLRWPKPDLRLRMVNTLHQQAVMLHKSWFSEPPFDLRYKVYADFDLNQRLLRRAPRFRYSPSFLTTATAGGISGTFYVRESLTIVWRNFGPLWALAAIPYYVALILRARNPATLRRYGGKRC